MNNLYSRFGRKATFIAMFSIITVIMGGFFIGQVRATSASYEVSVSGTTVSNILYVRGSKNITWSSINNANTSSPYTLVYSSDFSNGVTPVPITGANSISTESYLWNTINVDDGTYKVRVTGANGGSGFSKTFTIDNTAPETTYSISPENPSSTG